MFVLVLLAHVYAGQARQTMVVIPGVYRTIEHCEAAGKQFETGEGYEHEHVCIPAPDYRP